VARKKREKYAKNDQIIHIVKSGAQVTRSVNDRRITVKRGKRGANTMGEVSDRGYWRGKCGKNSTLSE